MVGFDERRDAGWTRASTPSSTCTSPTISTTASIAPKRDPEYAPGGGNPVDEIAAAAGRSGRADPADARRSGAEKYRHPLNYFKSALGLVLLREQILGPERFDWAFRKFIRDWAYQHPTPSDFFRAMDSAGGEDLSWFWRGWYFNNWTLDLAVQGVHPVDGDWRRGAVVTIANLDRLVLPATVQVDFADGSRSDIRLPVETWIQQSSIDLPLDSTQPVTAVTIDPDHVLPDKDRSNNVWQAPAR